MAKMQVCRGPCSAVHCSGEEVLLGTCGITNEKIGNVQVLQLALEASEVQPAGSALRAEHFLQHPASLA